VSVHSGDGAALDACGVQLAGVLDDLLATGVCVGGGGGGGGAGAIKVMMCLGGVGTRGQLGNPFVWCRFWSLCPVSSQTAHSPLPSTNTKK